MSKSERPWALEEIEPYALEIVEKLRPYCDKIEVAGSIRRRRPTIGDVEIVCVPKTHIVNHVDSDLFGEKTTAVETREYMFRSQVQRFGCLQSGDPDTGRHLKIQYQHAEQGLFQIDLFCTSREDWGRMLAIRTGPKEYSGKVIGGGWRKAGWVGTEDGLRKQKECTDKNGKWQCVVPRPTLPPPFHTEEFFFTFIGLEYVEPQYRFF